MCESKAVIVKNGREEVVMEDISYLEVSASAVVLVKVTGERRVMDGYRLKAVDFLQHKVYLEPL